MYLMPAEHRREKRLKDKLRAFTQYGVNQGNRDAAFFSLKFLKQTGVSATIFFSITKQELLYLSHAESSKKIN